MSVAREEEDETQRANRWPPPRVSIIASASARCASVAFGLGAEVLPAGSARPSTLLRCWAGHECHSGRRPAGRRRRLPGRGRTRVGAVAEPPCRRRAARAWRRLRGAHGWRRRGPGVPRTPGELVEEYAQ